MNGNPLKVYFDEGRPAFGGWCTTGAPFPAELIALHGYDWMGIDAQHGLWLFSEDSPGPPNGVRGGAAPLVDTAPPGRIPTGS